MNISKLKPGTWLIRKWGKVSGGEFDLAKFEAVDPQGEEFSYTHFFRQKGAKTISLNNAMGDGTINFVDRRMEFDWRKATKEERMKILMKL